MSPPPLDQQTQMRLGALSAGLRAQGVCILHQTSDHRFDLVENPPPSWPQDSMLGQVEADFLPAEIATAFVAAFDRVTGTLEDQIIEFDIGEGPQRRQFEARLLVDEA